MALLWIADLAKFEAWEMLAGASAPGHCHDVRLRLTCLTETGDLCPDWVKRALLFNRRTPPLPLPLTIAMPGADMPPYLDVLARDHEEAFVEVNVDTDELTVYVVPAAD